MKKVALVIIYNHQFNKNIEPLEALYASRFSLIIHLMPFYQGNKKNVIPVYENSYYFQGYIAQAWLTLSSYHCDDFLFIGDDLLLNPVIDERNYHEHLSINDQTSFIPYLKELHHRKSFWPRCKEAVEWRSRVNGLEVSGMLPSVEEALTHFERHNLKPKPLEAYLTNSNLKSEEKAGQQLLALPYPLIGSYSDIFAVPRQQMKMFSHYCGIFAATRLFVELAIPTALVMVSPKLVCESNLKLKGVTMWTLDDKKILEPYKNSLTLLINNFPENCLYLHPIKLSQWNS